MSSLHCFATSANRAQQVILRVNQVPAGYVTSQMAIARSIYGEETSGNAGSNVTKVLSTSLPAFCRIRR
jgi:alkylated DNA nucleotide flippase Atl1